MNLKASAELPHSSGCGIIHACFKAGYRLGLGLEKLLVGSFPGVAPAGHIRVGLMGEMLRTCGLGEHVGACVAHVCVRVTCRAAGSGCLRQQGQVVGRKQTPCFLGCLRAFQRTDTSPEIKASGQSVDFKISNGF